MDEKPLSTSFNERLAEYYAEKHMHVKKRTGPSICAYTPPAKNHCKKCDRYYHAHVPKNVYGTFCYNCSVDAIGSK